MSARPTEIADALVATLNGAELSQALNAERKWRARFPLEDESLRICVRAEDLDWEQISRAGHRNDYGIELWMTKRLQSDPDSEAAEIEEIDGLVLLAQDIMDYLEDPEVPKPELESIGALIVGIECPTICDENALLEFRRFSSVIKVKYRKLR